MMGRPRGTEILAASYALTAGWNFKGYRLPWCQNNHTGYWLPFIASVFVSRAVSHEISMVHNPLSFLSEQVMLGDTIVVEGDISRTATQVDFRHVLLKPRCASLTLVSTVEELNITNSLREVQF
ncbi:hypothetical protein CC78DRAFT_536154 [Lojkania enalia]|uniref:Uncharacterized protein n=1 Tax=Lojkania enalia TaxID=147567 RepID=A0A9P4N6M5_9PLEO|nr:hypothetical protein CC78DRAFT_536154 [Didymosphaeria enalia]